MNMMNTLWKSKKKIHTGSLNWLTMYYSYAEKSYLCSCTYRGDWGGKLIEMVMVTQGKNNGLLFRIKYLYCIY